MEHERHLLRKATTLESRKVTELPHKNTNTNIDKMRHHRNMFQMKEKDKTPKEELSEEETGNLPEKKFTVGL